MGMSEGSLPSGSVAYPHPPFLDRGERLQSTISPVTCEDTRSAFMPSLHMLHNYCGSSAFIANDCTYNLCGATVVLLIIID